MFTTSTQKKYWMFPEKAALSQMRSEANLRSSERLTQLEVQPVTNQEAEDLCRHFEYTLKDLCSCIERMSSSVVATALLFFKRFYLKNSVMEYHPRDIMLTCIFIACKVDEFYVSAAQLGGTAARHFTQKEAADTREQYSDPDCVCRIVLGLEPILMNKLQYDLFVHTSWRPLEGLLIDLKTRCPELPDAECLRAEAVRFIDKSLSTDASFLFSPSQIALAAVLQSASKQKLKLDQYVAHTLLGPEHRDKIKQIVPQIKAIKQLTKSLTPLDKRLLQQLEGRLEQCRNQSNNPISKQWEEKQLEEFEEEEEDRVAKKREKFVAGLQVS